ncbi:MAG: MFS transporter, partial [Muribaculaceae bacterium]|nr:MFS transporter [Muribaculaceae bacterium]
MNQSKTNSNGRLIAIITMFFIFAMISFVTNMAAPFGNIWGFKYSWSGMLGNLMNFAAYLFMGIPAGKMLTTVGYKKTSLIALAVGVIGLFCQWLSSIFGADITVFSQTTNVKHLVDGVITETPETVHVTLNLFIYLLGAFICGFCVCMLNTVVNPMLNLLGGGGNKGNQMIQTGGALNSLSGTLTPFLVGALLGTITKHTSMEDVAPLLFVGMGIFVFAFIVISRVSIPEPALERAKAMAAAGKNVKAKNQHSAWSFRHFVLGAIAIFFYVGVEIGIPGELNFYLSDSDPVRGGGLLVNGAAIAGAIVAIYWLLMLVGRTLSSAISGKISTKAQMTTVSLVALVLVLGAIFTPKTVGIDVPKFIYNPIEKTYDI